MNLPNINEVFYLDPVAKTILPPQLMLTTRSFKPIGLIKYTNWNFALVANGMDEFTFDVYKPANIEEDMSPMQKLLLTYEKKIWDSLVDLKLIYIQDYGRFEISVNYTDNTKTVKSVHAVSLECELAEAKLYDFHVNDDEAMATMEVNEYNKVNFDPQGNFIPTTLCNFGDPEHSLIHRVLADKAPHWKVGNQEEGTGYFTPFVTFAEDEDCELSKEFQRTYTCNGESIYEFLTGTVANECNVVFVFDTINRVVNCYSLTDCILQHSGEKMASAIGEDTNVFVSKEKLANEISITSRKDELKNCFRVEGGDDYINAMVAVANVNGTNYIIQFSNFQYEDMTDELVKALQEYAKAVKEAQPEYEKKYLELCDALDDLYEKESGMMPQVSTENNSSSGQLNIVKTKLIKFGTKNSYSSDSHVGLTNSIESLAKIYVTSNFDVEIVSGSTTYSPDTNKWTGQIKVTNETLENGKPGKTATDTITVETVDDEIRICEQKIEKALAKGDMISAKFVVDNYHDGNYEINEINRQRIYDYFNQYCLNRLISFYDAYETCVSTLIDMGKNDESSTEYKFYKMYVDIRNIIGEVKSKRQKEVDDASALVDKLNKECADYQSTFEMKTWFKSYFKKEYGLTDAVAEQYAEKYYLEYCSYRREDTYSNPNYISDGLTDSECIKKAKELLEVATKEIKKACVLQRTLNIDMNNLFMLEEFAPLYDKFSMFNYIRVATDDEILKLRLIGIDINGSSLSNVDVTFSEQVESIDGSINDLQSILEQAKANNSAFPSTIRQAKQGEEAARIIGSIRKNGLIAAQTLISNADNNEVTYGGFGILCKNQGDSGDYGLKQLRVIGNGIYLTTDAWETVEMCIGEIMVGKEERYGIIADTIIAGTIVGGDGGTYWDLDTGIFHMSSSTRVDTGEKDEEGNPIYEDVNTFVVNTAQGYINAYFEKDGSIAQLQADVNKLKTQYEKIENAIGSMIEGLNGYFHIRYSTSENGTPMTDVPTMDSKYIGIYYSGSNTAPSSCSDYSWQSISSSNGYLGTLTTTTTNADGEEVENTITEYLHLKFSDDGAHFTKIIASLDFNDWASGYYTDAKQADESYLCYPMMIKVVPGQRYKFFSNYSDLMFGISYYTGDKLDTYIKQVEARDSTITIPSDVNYMYIYLKPVPDPVYTYTYDKYKELNENGSFLPMVRDAITADGETVGQYFGTYVDNVEADSKNFNDYTWRKFSDEEDVRLMKSYIRQNANEIELKVSQEDFTGATIASKINLSPEDITIEGKHIHLNGTVISNESFKILTDGSAEATSMTVENEISTNILSVNTINNGEYQKTLVTTPTIYVMATPDEAKGIGNPDDSNKCENNANFLTLQGAINSIPRFMNGHAVYIQLDADTVENILVPFNCAGTIFIYLNGHTLNGYISVTGGCNVRIYGATRNAEDTADNYGTIHPHTGTNYSGYSTSVGCGFNSALYLHHVNIYGSDNLQSGINLKTCVCTTLGGYAYINDVKILNTDFGFTSHAGGRMHCRKTSGIATQCGFVAAGGYTSLENGTQAGGKGFINSSGVNTGEIINEFSGGTIKYHNVSFEGAATSGGTTAGSNTKPTEDTNTQAPSVTTVTKYKTYTSTSSKSIRHYNGKDGSSASWRSDSDAKTGMWEKQYGYHAAFWFFGDQFDEIKNKNITEITITFTRLDGGTSENVTHNFYAHTHKSKPSTVTPSIVTSSGTTTEGLKGLNIGKDAVKRQEKGTVVIDSSSIINAIKSRANGICCIAPNTNNSNYSVMSGEMKVKIKYTETTTT